MTPKLKLIEERRPRTRFRASDYGKLATDIILEFQGVPYTNPTLWNNTLRMAAGKGVEIQMVDILKKNGHVPEEYDQETTPPMVIERNGVNIAMQFDAIGKESVILCDETILPQGGTVEIHEGEPIEIKSVNNKNSYDVNDYINNKPRESYVGQLSIYMDALGKDRGHLFVSTIDGLHTFWFVCERLHDRVYRCGSVEIDLDKEYARFASIWAVKDLPVKDWFAECGRYKIPVGEIDWLKISTGNIAKARSGEKVVGDEDQWKILYSPYCDMIIEKQGAKRGYNDAEIAIIKTKTAGYTSKKKNESTN